MASGRSVEQANERGRNTLIGHLGIEVLEASADGVKGRMPVDDRTRTPAGVLHGGASVAFAETLGTWAAAFNVDGATTLCVGLEINANHLRAVRDGFVYGEARPIHRGRRTHVWEVRITDGDDKLVCISRFTVAILDQPSGY